MLWIRIWSDRHHFGGSGSAYWACQSGSGAGSGSVTISTKCKANLYGTFSRKFQCTVQNKENSDAYDVDEKEERYNLALHQNNADPQHWVRNMDSATLLV